jgi:hypothetical protein
MQSVFCVATSRRSLRHPHSMRDVTQPLYAICRCLSTSINHPRYISTSSHRHSPRWTLLTHTYHHQLPTCSSPATTTTRCCACVSYRPHAFTHLHIVLHYQLDFYTDQLELAVPANPPRHVTNDLPADARNSVYIDGGVLFVTSRILVVDMLLGKLPTDLVTGMVVLNAHRVSLTSSEAFILRLFRLQNRAGFIKAFSDNPEALSHGFNGVERVMKALWVRKLYLWPRFHKVLQDALESKKQPVVKEVQVNQTKRMARIQAAIRELLMSCLRELKQKRPDLDMEKLSAETALLAEFDRNLSRQLDPARGAPLPTPSLYLPSLLPPAV